eukprot:6108326-Amphidinium_carterae.1
MASMLDMTVREELTMPSFVCFLTDAPSRACSRSVIRALGAAQRFAEQLALDLTAALLGWGLATWGVTVIATPRKGSQQQK